MSFAFEPYDYVKISRDGLHKGDIAYVTDRFKLPDPHPCNMYVVIIINANADELTIPEEYLTELHTNLEELMNIVNNEYTSRVCECGSDKLGYSNHYAWCPKYKG
ncbi:MAG: hypothetical protein Unbinned8261contig1001_13 [Prokaryotic dsDNA virus sp.]|nr:MAG: hypothetical protein Unbinned8261contig1001_13 [Prokaryotic dsDNA virus sp.]|tara:strand:- start:18244 stop:18558 length:315 start_codon:yes stop_codon:yes gene_type:complete